MNIDIRCLCLDKRKDLWIKLGQKVKSLTSLEMRPFICGDGSDETLKYDHIDQSDTPEFFLYGTNETIKNHYNAFLCHKKIAQMALENKADKLIILEDDSYLVESRFKTIFFQPQIQDFIAKDNWDLLYLGWWLTKEKTEDREDLEELWKTQGLCGIDKVPRPPEVKHEICGFHGVMINKHFIPHIVDAPIGPLDALMNRNLDWIKAYYLWPKIVHVHSTYSYCEKSFTKRNDIQ